MTWPHEDAYDLFVSYAHADDQDGRVTALVEAIRGIRQETRPDQPWRVFFDSDAIRTMDDWEERIRAGLNSAGILLVLLSPAYFASRWCRREWEEFRKQQDAPDRVAGLYLETDVGYESPADTWQRELRSRQHLDVRAWHSQPLFGSRRQQILRPTVDDISDRLSKLRRVRKISISRLPSTGKHVFGREDPLKVLDDCWDKKDGTNVVCLVGWGGVGKSSLVNAWLGEMALGDYRCAERVYAWSFYTQGTTDRVASADEFIEAALSWFGDPDPARGSPRDRGERLAGLVRRHRTLLILDGLETLQGAPGPGGRGSLKDPALAALLCELAGANRGLCVVTTRLPVADLERFEASTVRREDLAGLTPQAGSKLLEKLLGGRNDQEELEAASAEFGGHCLALTLLGGYLADVHDGDIRKRDEVKPLEDVGHGEHAQRVMGSYAQLFQGKPELGVLRLLSLFDRPADVAAVAALREHAPIPGLTDALVGLGRDDWRRVLKRLRDARLLAEPSPDAPDSLDTHPLIRAYFAGRLREEHLAAWQAGNRRLYEHFKESAPPFPGSLREMAPLFLAVAHGCAAERHQTAFEEVYQPRIFRGNYFSTDELNAFGSDLAAVACFFERDEGRVAWDRPVGPLPDPARAVVLRVAGWDLRSLGRMCEAKQAFRASVELEERREGWENATVSAGQRSQINLDCGDLREALEDAESAQRFGMRSGRAYWRQAARVLRASALFQLGRRTACEQECDAVRREIEPAGFSEDAGDEVDHTFIAFRWCDLRLGLVVSPCDPQTGPVDPEAVRRACDEVEARSEQVRRIAARRRNIPLAEAVADLLRGRGLVVRGLYGGSPGARDEGQELLTFARAKLKAQAQEFYLSALRAWVALHLRLGDLDAAEAPLDEALAVATRSGMKLYVVDAHLQSAWLRLARGKYDAARSSWDAARALVGELDYHRREDELDKIWKRVCDRDGSGAWEAPGVIDDRPLPPAAGTRGDTHAERPRPE